MKNRLLSSLSRQYPRGLRAISLLRLPPFGIDPSAQLNRSSGYAAVKAAGNPPCNPIFSPSCTVNSGCESASATGGKVYLRRCEIGEREGIPVRGDERVEVGIPRIVIKESAGRRGFL